MVQIMRDFSLKNVYTLEQIWIFDSIVILRMCNGVYYITLSFASHCNIITCSKQELFVCTKMAAGKIDEDRLSSSLLFWMVFEIAREQKNG